MALSKIVENSIADSAISSSKLKDFAAAVDLNGVELVLDADADTSITADTDDRIDFKIAGVEHFSFSNSSGDTIIKPMVDAKDIKFQQFDGRTLLDINDGGFVGIENGATGPGVIRIFEDTDNGSNYVGLSVGNVSTAYTLVFPNADGSSGQALTTNGSGVLSFTTLSANTPSSADGQALGSASLEWSDLFLADSSTIQFGADQDTILTHTDGSGLTLNSTNKLMFNDASQFIHAPSATVLDIGATDEIELTATLIDVVGNATVSGTLGVTGVVTANAGVVVDNFTLDGTTLALSSGDFTVDVAGDILLDAGDSDLRILQGGTDYCKITKDGNNTAIKSQISDGDLILRGSDSGSQIDALTFDMSAAGAATFNDKITAVGTSVFTNLDISGDVDVDGTTNLDVVDIDGAVDMASTLQVDGSITSSDGMTITTADNSDTLTLTSTDTDANGGPNLRLLRSATGADADTLGVIDFAGKDDGGNLTDYARIEVVIDDASDNSEDASLIFRLLNGGALNQTLKLTGPETVINDASIDHDFRVETNGQTHAIFAEGGTDRVGILNSSPQKALDVTGDAKVSTDLTVGDDLFMLSDSAVIHFGADSDITMTHVADTGLTIQNSGNAVATLLLKSTDADENIGPSLHLHRDSANAADNDETGQIVWRFDNDAQEDTEGFKIKTLIKDASNGTEDFQFDMQTMVAGSIRSRMKSDGTETVFNEDSVDLDFRVESNDNTHAIHVDAANNVVDIAQELHVNTDNSGSEVRSLYVRPYGSTAGLYDGFQIGTDSARSYIQTFRQTTSTTSHHIISNTNGAIGSITTNGTSTAFNTSSDHRLKENVNYDFDATTRLKQLKPARFNFIKDADKTLDGFLAHEVQSIIPEAVHGTHNETETKQKVVINSDNLVIAENVEQTDWETGKIADDNGNTKYPTDSTWEATKVVPVYQGIDQAKLVPLLVKTIQELEARIKTLEDA